MNKLTSIAKKMLKVQPTTPAAGIDASASKTRLMLESQMLDNSDLGPRGDITLTPRGELKRSIQLLEPTPKTSRNENVNKSDFEFDESYAAPGGSTSRVPETPKDGDMESLYLPK